MATMASWQSPDNYFITPTIDPARLHVFGNSTVTQTEESAKMEMIKHPRRQSTEVPRIPRISSHWDPTVGNSPPDWDKKCWETTHPNAKVSGWQNVYFDNRMVGYYIDIYVPPDPEADLLDLVLIDPGTRSIYDAYLLRADIAKNHNHFRRLQIVHSPFHNRYRLFDRYGRVGLLGECVTQMDSWIGCGASSVVEMFKTLFRDYTGMEWADRYSNPSRETCSYPLLRQYTYIDLDYSRQVTDDSFFIQQQVQLPNYQAINANIDEPVRLLMEDILYGGPVISSSSPNSYNLSIPGANFEPFTAPYQILSLRSITAAFQTLKQIASYLSSTPEPPRSSSNNNTNEKPGTIRWKTIMSASSRYRSEIPFCAGWHNSSRPGVISNYHTLFLELRFLHSLNPQTAPPEIVALMDEISRRGSLQVWAYGKALTTQPLYQAYSSLRHGFRLLTDTSSLEFRELSAYLQNSNQPQTHHINFELQGIYRVFTKAGLNNPYHDWLRSTSEDQQNSSTRRNRLLLWHGTPLDSLLGILEMGLQIRKRCPSPPPPPPPPPPPAPKSSSRNLLRGRGTSKRQFSIPNPIYPPPSFPVPTSSLYNPPIQPGKIANHRPRPIPLTSRARAAAALKTPRNKAIMRRPRLFGGGGSMFGDGIYLADASSKSAGYCGHRANYSPNGENNDGVEAILLLCEADVGSTEERVRTLYSLPDGHEVVREFQEAEARKKEMEAEAEREMELEVEEAMRNYVNMDVDGQGFRWKRGDQEEEEGGGKGVSNGNSNVWLYWGNKGDRLREEQNSAGNGKRKSGGIVGTGVRCIEGVGRTGPKDGPEGWKKVTWGLDWDWNKTGNSQQPQNGLGRRKGKESDDYGDVWMPDTLRPYGFVAKEAVLAFNEYVLYNPAHVQIRYILRVKIKDIVRYR